VKEAQRRVMHQGHDSKMKLGVVRKEGKVVKKGANKKNVDARRKGEMDAKRQEA
jgi:hypothetical protein